MKSILKRVILLLCVIGIGIPSRYVYAETSYETVQYDLPAVLAADHGSIHYDADVLFRATQQSELYGYNAELPSMLDTEITLFSGSKVKEREQRYYSDEEYDTQVTYLSFENDATLLLSSAGRIEYQTPLGQALHQIYQSYPSEIDEISPNDASLQDSLAYTKGLLKSILSTIETVPDVCKSLSSAEAAALAAQFDADYASYFSKKTNGLLATVKGCADSIYLELAQTYGGVDLGDFFYVIRENDRIIDMKNITAIFCDNTLQYFSAPYVYVISDVQNVYSSLYGLTDAVEHFEEKLNEGLILQDQTVYRISFENVVAATGTDQTDFEIVPAWHFFVIPTATLNDSPAQTAESLLESATKHYVFHAATGQWISR